MYEYIPEEKLNTAIQKAAKLLKVDPAVFERAVFDKKQAEYDRADIEQWLQDNGYKYTDDDIEEIWCNLRDDWDADRGTWSNIESAYYNCGLQLPNADDEE